MNNVVRSYFKQLKIKYYYAKLFNKILAIAFLKKLKPIQHHTVKWANLV